VFQPIVALYSHARQKLQQSFHLRWQSVTWWSIVTSVGQRSINVQCTMDTDVSVDAHLPASSDANDCRSLVQT